MLFLLNDLLSAILEHPFDGLGLRAVSLDCLGVFEGGPEVVELRELD